MAYWNRKLNYNCGKRHHLIRELVKFKEIFDLWAGKKVWGPKIKIWEGK